MPNEYCLQKKSLHTWQYVTWYSDLDQAIRNFLVASKEGNGYSWRLVEVIVVEEKLLDGERKAEPGDDLVSNLIEPHKLGINSTLGPWEKPTEPIKSSWGTPMASGWGKPLPIDDIKPEGHSHGLSGSVWMVHFGLKKKTRVPMDQMDSLMAQGYVKGSPRTVL